MRASVGIWLVLLAGCASAAPQRAGDRAEIGRDIIEATSYSNALDLVRGERPHWLRTRGRSSVMYDTDVVIYVDGVRAGGPRFLAQVHPIDVERLRYYDAREAQYRFGTGHVHGAIDVITRRGWADN